MKILEFLIYLYWLITRNIKFTFDWVWSEFGLGIIKFKSSEYSIFKIGIRIQILWLNIAIRLIKKDHVIYKPNN